MDALVKIGIGRRRQAGKKTNQQPDAKSFSGGSQCELAWLTNLHVE